MIDASRAIHYLQHPMLRLLTHAIYTAAVATLFIHSSLTFAQSLNHLRVPDGFTLSLFAENIDNARQLAESEAGIVYAGSRRAGNVYALFDENNDGRAEVSLTLASNLTLPSGIALLNGDLYIAAVSTIYRIRNVDSAVKSLRKTNQKPTLEIFDDSWPTEQHHGWKYLRAYIDDNGNDKLIVPVGAPCNTCEVKLPFAAIWSLDLKTKTKQLLAQGVRNSVGFDFQPETGHLWFTDNGRDNMGEEIPADELNGLSKARLTPKAGDTAPHFGFPYFYGREIADPEFAKIPDHLPQDAEFYHDSRHNIPAHYAPLGMTFYTGTQFPKRYHNSILIAEHGSWNRKIPGGYRVTQVTLGQKQLPLDYQPLVDGFLELKGTPKKFEAIVHGRPSDVLVAHDGSVLIADDHGNAIYRLSYNASQSKKLISD